MNIELEKSQLTTTALNALKRNLPKGAYSTIAKALNVNKSTVSRVLDGKIENLEIIMVAIKLAEERRDTIDALTTKIKDLSSI